MITILQAVLSIVLIGLGLVIGARRIQRARVSRVPAALFVRSVLFVVAGVAVAVSRSAWVWIACSIVLLIALNVPKSDGHPSR